MSNADHSKQLADLSKPAVGIVTPPGQKALVNLFLGSRPLTHDSLIPGLMSVPIVFEHTLRDGDLLPVEGMSAEDPAKIVLYAHQNKGDDCDSSRLEYSQH
jgi:hypothetical protein